ncbi:MAG: DUF2147 domain-containing protein [Cellvibrionaceae bacterium]
MRIFQGLLWVAALCFSLTSQANDQVIGQWNTLDRFGQPESLVELYKTGDELQGRIVKLYDETQQDAVCGECFDHRENQPIAGLVFITGLESEGQAWVNGTVLDPETGNEYDCKLWLDGDTLKLKAGFGFISQTKEWKRAN